MYVGKKLKQLRQSLELTQDDFAERLGVSRSYYAAIEISKRKLTKKLKDKIVTTWNVSTNYFEGVNGVEKETKSDILLRGKIERVNGGVDKNRGIEGNIKNLFDNMKLYNAYYNQASEVLPKELKDISLLLNIIYLSINELKNDVDKSKIDSAIDSMEFSKELGSGNFKMPSFEAYLEMRQKRLSAFVKYKPELERMNKDLLFIINTLDEIKDDVEII